MAGQKLVFGVLGKQRRRRIMEAVDNVDRSITSSFGEIKNFRDCDIVYGPDGTMYEPKFIVSVVEDAISIINRLTRVLLKNFSQLFLSYIHSMYQLWLLMVATSS
jgi:hypothetical protein